MLKYALLGLLTYRPMSGYDMEQFIKSSIAHFWHAKLSQIYRTLKEMEAEGLITSRFEAQDQHRSKRLYTITSSGEAAMEAWLSQLDTELGDIKLPFLVRVFFFGSADRQHINTQMHIWRELHRQRLNHYETSIRKRVQGTLEAGQYTEKAVFFWQATLRFGEMYESMVLAWFDEVMREFERFD
jgi:PadR family transcriptional regulator, regulatory protein AphA